MATEWYYQSMGEKIGPFNASELRQRAVAGELTHDTLVTRTGTEDWVTADRVKGLLAPPSKDELEKIELRAEETLPSLNAETQTGGDFLSVKDQDAVKLFGFLFLAFLIVYMFVLNSREKETYVSTPFSTPVNRDTNNSAHRMRLDRRAAELEARLQTISPSDHDSIKKLVSELDALELEVRQATSQFNRQPYERGYTLQQRKEAARLTLIDQGYSPADAEQTVNDMEKYDLLLDPPRRSN